MYARIYACMSVSIPFELAGCLVLIACSALSLKYQNMIMLPDTVCVGCSALASCSALSIESVSVVWWCQLGLAPAYLIDLYQPVSQARDCRSLRSAERGVLVVPFLSSYFEGALYKFLNE